MLINIQHNIKETRILKKKNLLFITVPTSINLNS